MAARTCLLCGKPLSRIWAGTGEDFCSREHRNQYRLRKGMGRLMEASAVASVLRRRESPKQIPTRDLRAPGAATPRGFLEALRRPQAEISIRPPRLAGKPKVQAATRTRTPKATASVDGAARASTSPARFKPVVAWTRTVDTRLSAQVMPALAAKEPPVAGATSRRPAPRLAWKGSGQPNVEALLARSERRSASTMPESRPARPVAAARVGRALRVSTATGFRLPAKALPSSGFKGLEVGGLPTPRIKSMVTAAAPPRAEGNVLVVALPVAEIPIPSAPEANLERRFRWPGVMEMSVKYRNAANETRGLAVPFGPPDEAKERK